MGRVILSEILPEGVDFSAVNRVMNKKALAQLIDTCYRTAGVKATVILADRLKDTGYHYATRSGISISIKDMTIPERKSEILQIAFDQVQEIERQYNEGLITEGEKYNKAVDIWAKATEDVAAEMMREIGATEIVGPKGEKTRVESFNPIYMMADSGARGSKDQMRQLAGMRGLMAKPSGEIIETPITANFREGLTVLQYFISTHGARKGLADTALKTANSGYLTRRLVDVSQDVIIAETDCGTMDGIEVEALLEAGEIIQRLGDRILGRTAQEDIVDPVTGEIIVPMGAEINEKKVIEIEDAGIEKVNIRSALTCRSPEAFAPCAMAATSLRENWRKSARRSASLPPSPSASLELSSPCVRSISAAPRARASSERRSATATRARSSSSISISFATAKAIWSP